MAPMHLTDHLAALHIEGGKQRGRAVPDIVVGAAVDIARARGEPAVGAVEPVDLGLVVVPEEPPRQRGVP
jgi:hypothetical protein